MIRPDTKDLSQGNLCSLCQKDLKLMRELNLRSLTRTSDKRNKKKIKKKIRTRWKKCGSQKKWIRKSKRGKNNKDQREGGIKMRGTLGLKKEMIVISIMIDDHLHISKTRAASHRDT